MRNRGAVLAVLWAAVLCLLLCACGGERQAAQDPEPDSGEADQTPVENEQAGTPSHETERACSIDHLTVELVVDWDDSDRILSEVDELSQLLQEGLQEQYCQVEAITITLSTAGGFTGSALAEGGVDIACLPAVDYVAWESDAYAVLTTDEALCSAVVAVTAAREALNEDFRSALTQALLETEAGTEFLEIYCPGLTYVPAEDAAISAVREWLAAQEEEAHGA